MTYHHRIWGRLTFPTNAAAAEAFARLTEDADELVLDTVKLEGRAIVADFDEFLAYSAPDPSSAYWALYDVAFSASGGRISTQTEDEAPFVITPPPALRPRARAGAGRGKPAPKMRVARPPPMLFQPGELDWPATSDASPGPDVGHTVRWRAEFRVGSERWLHAHAVDLIHVLSQAAFWPELRYVRVGTAPFRPADDHERVLRSLRFCRTLELADTPSADEPDPSPDAPAAAAPQRSEVSVSLDVSPDTVIVQIHIGGRALGRLGQAATTGVANALATLAKRWRRHAWLSFGWAVVTAADGSLPNPGLPRGLEWEVRSICDVIDRKIPTELRPTIEPRCFERPFPATARAVERDGLLVVSWCPDPRQRPLVVAAADAHEQWLGAGVERP